MKETKPPGKKLVKRMSLRTKYWLLTIAGFVFIGGGLPILAESIYLKNTQQPFARWALMGCYAFILIFTGLAALQAGIRFRILIDVRREIRRNLKRIPKNAKPQPKKENPAK